MNRFIHRALILSLAVLMLLCVGVGTASARSMTIFHNMDDYVEGESLTIMWYTDVAGADHYDCTILNQTTGVYVRSRATSSSGYDAYVSGSKVTAGYYKAWVGAVAADGTVLDQGTIYFTVNAASECDHRWSSRTGCCTWCDEECPHNNGVYQVETGATGVSISSTQHRITWYYDEECKICRYVISEGKTRTEKGSHSFDANGDCEMCDYRAACKHSDTELEETSCTYTQYDETYHKVKTISNEVCANANCGKIVERGIIDTYKAKHNMVNGKCKDCGYAKTYDPLSVSISRNSSSAYTGSTIGATCSASGGTGKYNYYWYVYRNGTEIYSTSSWDTRGSYTASQAGSYTFKVLVEDKTTKEQKSATSGTITVTEAPCQHTSTRKVQDGELQYTKISDSKHSIRTNWADVCTKCNATVRTYYSTSEAAHTYSGSSCKYCGSAKPTEACTHASKTSKELSRSYRASTSATEHIVDITWEDRCANSACAQLLNNTRVTTTKEAHTFSGDVCTRCGYARVSEQGCDHASQKKTQLSRSVKQHDADFHAVVTTYKVTCANASCGEVLSSSKTETTYAKHTFQGNACTACGYKAACKHTTESKVSNGSTTYKIADANQHFAATSYTVTCADCGKVIDANYTESVRFSHTMVNGSCKYCGYQAAVEPGRELISTRLINETTEVHRVVETWKVTHADGAVTTEETSRYEEHVATRTSAEAKHPHKQFIVCECGARPYTGKEGYLATCTTCNPTPQTAPEEQDCTVTGNHTYSNAVYAEQHPHPLQYVACKCGAISYDVSPMILGVSLNCCQCGHHNYGGAVPDGGYYRFYCACGHSICIEGTAAERMGEFFIQADTTLWESDPFRIIGGEAIGKLTEGGYVYISETIDATKDPGAAMTGAVVGLFEADYDEQQVLKWEYLITQMLVRNPEYGYSGEIRDLEAAYNVQNAANTVDDAMELYEKMGDAALIKTVDDWIEQYDNVITSLMKNQDVLEAAIDAGNATEEQVRQWNQVTAQIDSMSETRTTLAGMSETGSVVGETAEMLSFAVEGFLTYENTRQLYNDYYELSILYDANMAKLNSIITSAQAIGNYDIVVAAQNLKATLTEQANMTLEQMNANIAVDTALQIGTGYVVDSASELLNTVLNNAAPPLKIVGAVGSVADFMLGWGDSYESAQTLMLLRDMDNKLGLEVQQVLQDDPENGRYLAELYIILQIEGLNQTKDFLQDYEDARGLSVSEFNINDLDRYMSTIDSHINCRVYTMYGQYQVEKETLDTVVITSAQGILRTGPDAQSGYVYTAHKGESFEFLGRENSWYKVLYKGNVAYVSVSVSTLE